MVQMNMGYILEDHMRSEDSNLDWRLHSNMGPWWYHLDRQWLHRHRYHWAWRDECWTRRRLSWVLFGNFNFLIFFLFILFILFIFTGVWFVRFIFTTFVRFPTHVRGLVYYVYYLWWVGGVRCLFNALTKQRSTIRSVACSVNNFSKLRTSFGMSGLHFATHDAYAILQGKKCRVSFGLQLIGRWVCW